jgi:hypothetical protein
MEVQKGNYAKDSHQLKSKAWQSVAENFNGVTGLTLNRGQVKNKWNEEKKKHAVFKKIYSSSGVGSDRVVTADVLATFDEKTIKMFKDGYPEYDAMEEVTGGGSAATYENQVTSANMLRKVHSRDLLHPQLKCI